MAVAAYYLRDVPDRFGLDIVGVGRMAVHAACLCCIDAASAGKRSCEVDVDRAVCLVTCLGTCIRSGAMALGTGVSLAQVIMICRMVACGRDA